MEYIIRLLIAVYFNTAVQHEGRSHEISSLLLFLLGHTVVQLVEVLRHKPESSGFDLRRAKRKAY